MDTDLPREKAAFITQAEIALLSCFAEEYGLSYDRTAVEQEYDAHLLEIQDTDLYGKELLFSTALQAALGMDADAYRTWSVDEACKDYDVQELLDDIASLYSHISDAETLRGAFAAKPAAPFGDSRGRNPLSRRIASQADL